MTIARPIFLAAVLCAANAVAAAPHPELPVLDAAGINASCAGWLADLRHRQARMEAGPIKGGDIFAEWNALSIAVEDITGPLQSTINLHPSKAAREAADACQLKLAPFSVDVFQSRKLYRRVRLARPVDAVQRQYQRDLLDNFEDTGVTLPAARRARVKDINQRLTDLTQQFDKAVRDDATIVTMHNAEMAGLPEAYLNEQKRDADGNYLLPLTYPAYGPFMSRARDGAARRRYWIAMTNKGGNGNLALLDETVRLRREQAQLYGEPDYASYLLRRRMAQTPKAVYAFLDDVKGAVTALEKQDIAALREAKARELGQPLDATTVERWDVSYYEEQVRQARYQVDQEALRKYFPTEQSLAYTLKISEILYGIRFVASPAPLWSPEVRHYDVYEAASDGKADEQRFIGSIYLDLFPRDGKYGHAHAEGARNVSALAGRTAIGVLVTNLNSNGLNEDELSTLIHEFGHVLHGILSKARYVDQAGANVKLDFVEAPSQMFEEWGKREQPLRLFAELCKDCPQLTHAQFEQMDAARRFGSGLMYARQWVYSTYDMALAGPDAPAALATWERIEGATVLGHVTGTHWPSGFTHIMDGYAAGYYGYMWSQVLALDMLSAYGDNLLDAAVGRRYRDAILSQGAQIQPGKLVENFLGRKPNSSAFFKEITGQR